MSKRSFHRRSVSLAKVIHERVLDEAREADVSVSAWITQAIREKLERTDRPIRVKLHHISWVAANKAHERSSEAIRKNKLCAV